jgi:nicotinate-nucleotide pyrophosphorylase (carboxylating)
MKKTNLLSDFIQYSLKEDIGNGDHSSLACIPESSTGKAMLLVKELGVIAGIRIAIIVFSEVDKSLQTDILIRDGSMVHPGDIVLYVTGNLQSILRSERMVLNIMQRMSGIATNTQQYVNRLKGLKTKVLDTRKTSPGMRLFEKEAVRLGGGENHRLGLYDMIMLKDNHIDFAGGIRTAINRTLNYLETTGKDLKVEIEARDLFDVEEILSEGGINRILLDNFTIEDTRKAVKMINNRFETESSGGITLENIRDYAECGVDYISVGALTHHLKSLDMSLKAVRD